MKDEASSSLDRPEDGGRVQPVTWAGELAELVKYCLQSVWKFVGLLLLVFMVIAAVVLVLLIAPGVGPGR